MAVDQISREEELARRLEEFSRSQTAKIDQAWVDGIVAKTLVFMEEVLLGYRLFHYQRRPAARIIESLIINDGEEITMLQARQSGKTETVADVIATLMVLLPILAKAYPEELGKFKDGLWVGVFAPTDEQAETLHGRIVDRLTSDRALEMMLDPEIDDRPLAGGKMIRLRHSGSFCRRQTAHPRAKVESKSYHIVLVDEAQDADDTIVRKSIHPMLAFYNGTIVKTGTPTTRKGDFYRAINQNKRRQTKRGARPNHFQADWRECARANENYRRFIEREKLRLGEDSDEFQMSYALKWLLERGMFVASSILDINAPEFLGDKGMEIVHAWHRDPVVVGIDPAREHDSTVVTVVWVNWEWEDMFGFREHRILNWLEIQGEEWEQQYSQIYNFLTNYRVMAIGVDAQGMGDAVAERLAHIFHDVPVAKLGSDRPSQSKRWKHLTEIVQRRLITWPAAPQTRRLRTYKRFVQQMEDLEKHYIGDYMMAAAPEEADAHDDYADSLAIACIMTDQGAAMPQVEVTTNPFVAARRRR